MKKWIALSLLCTVLFSACAHSGCCAKCKRHGDMAAAGTETAVKA